MAVRQTDQDRAILAVLGHPEGPQFIGPRAVRCRNYDEHRDGFHRVGRTWVCTFCAEDGSRG